MFLRGYGSQNHTKNNGSIIGFTNTAHASANLGIIQGDAMREIWGAHSSRLGANGTHPIGTNSEGAFVSHGHSKYVGCVINSVLNTHEYDWAMYFSVSRMAPTDNEFRPANIAVKYLIRALN